MTQGAMEKIQVMAVRISRRHGAHMRDEQGPPAMPLPMRMLHAAYIVVSHMR